MSAHCSVPSSQADASISWRSCLETVSLLVRATALSRRALELFNITCFCFLVFALVLPRAGVGSQAAMIAVTRHKTLRRVTTQRTRISRDNLVNSFKNQGTLGEWRPFTWFRRQFGRWFKGWDGISKSSLLARESVSVTKPARDTVVDVLFQDVLYDSDPSRIGSNPELLWAVNRSNGHSQWGYSRKPMGHIVN
jgi:hypothetical protein